jgi:hypothetical protein
MDKQARRDAVRDYKERKIRAGIFRLTCATTGETWVGAARNLDQKNGLFFGLRLGSHRNRELQQAWNAHGGEAGIEYAVVEELLDDKLTPLGREDWLKARERHWREALSARSVT